MTPSSPTRGSSDWIVSGETLALRKRAYGSQLLLDELDFVLATGRTLGLNWSTVRDIGSPMARSIIAEVPILNSERELVVRLEDQPRSINENDLRDMASFIDRKSTRLNSSH